MNRSVEYGPSHLFGQGLNLWVSSSAASKDPGRIVARFRDVSHGVPNPLSSVLNETAKHHWVIYWFGTYWAISHLYLRHSVRIF